MKLSFLLATPHAKSCLRRGNMIQSGLDWLQFFSTDTKSEASNLLDSKVCIRSRQIKKKTQHAVYFFNPAREDWEPLLIFKRDKRE